LLSSPTTYAKSFFTANARAPDERTNEMNE
jgi:hypothetical protein